MQQQLLSARYVQALELVARLFRDENRKMSDTPYVTHLCGVSHILAQLTDDEDVLIAGLLHDVVEDISPEVYTAAQLEIDFGARVRQLVEAVSHDDTRYEKREARQRYLDQITDGPIEACLVSGADLLYNAADIVRNYTRDPALLAQHMGGERAALREWFWQARFAIVQKRLGADHKLVQELANVMQDLTAVHDKIR